MLDEALRQIQAHISPEIARKFNLSTDAAEKAANTMAATVTEKLADQASSGHYEMLSNVFGTGANTSEANRFMSGLISAAGANLITKAGIDISVASKMASEYVPKFVAIIADKSGDEIKTLLESSALGSLLGAFGNVVKK